MCLLAKIIGKENTLCNQIIVLFGFRYKVDKLLLVQVMCKVPPKCPIKFLLKTQWKTWKHINQNCSTKIERNFVQLMNKTKVQLI